VAAVLEQVKSALQETAAATLAISSALSPEPPTNDYVIVCGGQYWNRSSGTLTVTTPSGCTQDQWQHSSTNIASQLSHKKWTNGVDGTNVIQTTSETGRPHSLIALHYSGLVSASDAYDVGGKAEYTSDLQTKTVTATASASAEGLGVAVFCVASVSGETLSPTYTSGWTQVASIHSANSGKSELFVATKVIAASETASCQLTHTGTASQISGVIGVYTILSAASPVNTVPDDTGGLFVTSDSATVLADIGPTTPISVVDAAGLTTCRVWCTSGDMTVTLSGSVVISAGANTSSDLTLGSGATTAEFNTVLATLAYQGDLNFHGTDTINVVSDGSGGTDTDTFTVLNDPRSITLTASVPNFASLVTAVASTQMRLDVGVSSGTCAVTATDDDALTDEQTITLTVDPGTGAVVFKKDFTKYNAAMRTGRRER